MLALVIDWLVGNSPRPIFNDRPPTKFEAFKRTSRKEINPGTTGEGLNFVIPLERPVWFLSSRAVVAGMVMVASKTVPDRKARRGG